MRYPLWIRNLKVGDEVIVRAIRTMSLAAHQFMQSGETITAKVIHTGDSGDLCVGVMMPQVQRPMVFELNGFAMFHNQRIAQMLQNSPRNRLKLHHAMCLKVMDSFTL